MSDDWQVGDLALCVDDRPCVSAPYPGAPFGIGRGEVLEVIGVVLDGEDELALIFRDRDHGEECAGFEAARFRKIRPDEHEDCEPEFVTLLNRIKRKVEA